MTGFSKTDFAAAGELVRIATAEKGAVNHFGNDWRAFWRRLTTRRTLRRLSDQQLGDVGLSRAEAEQEASLPFWKL